MLDKLAGILAIFGLSITQALADGITVYPTTIVLDRSNHIGVLTISNQSDHDTTYELAGYRWTQTNGEDILSLDKSFIVTPPVITLPAGEARIVRVGLMSAEQQEAVEQTYRLRISELQPAAASEGAGLNVRLQLLLPVFSGGNDKLKLSFSARATADRQACITGTNNGEAHAKLVWIEAADDPEHRVPMQKYLLANSASEICVDLPTKVGESLTVGATSAYLDKVHPYQVAVAGP